jgi:CO/xanthine dehydrogenase FAD-binding subunit
MSDTIDVDEITRLVFAWDSEPPESRKAAIYCLERRAYDLEVSVGIYRHNPKRAKDLEEWLDQCVQNLSTLRIAAKILRALDGEEEGLH